MLLFTLEEEDHISDILYDPPVPIASKKILPELNTIQFNPQNEIVDPEWKRKFNQLHSKYSDVFSSSLSGYNGKFGAICASVDIGDSPEFPSTPNFFYQSYFELTLFPLLV